MKKVIFLFALLMSISFAKAQQQPSVERSISGVQLGIPTLRVYYEVRLSNNFSLRAEAGVNSAFWWYHTLFEEGFSFVFFPEFSIQPRWYYNLNRRNERGRDISNNAANFIKINTIIAPDWMIGGDEDTFVGSVAFIPTWGIRRNIGNRFEYEAGMGIGYGFNFDGGWNGVVFRPHLRIGYRF